MFDRLIPAALADAAEAHLRADGVARGHIVAWLGHNSWDELATLVACERLGAVLLPLNWRLTAAELATVCRHAGVGHLMGTPEMQTLAEQLLRVYTPTSASSDGVLPGDLLLVYTSGTTGQPKGAMHTAAAMQANAVAAIAAQGLDARTRALAVLPLFHVGGLCIQTLPTLAAGGQVLLHPRFEPDAWFDAVASWRPTTTLLVPAVLRALVEHPRWAAADLSSLRFVTTGSQIVPRPLIDAFHARGIPVAQVYGATETGPVSIVVKPADALAQPHSAGHPAIGVQVMLADDGEVLLKAANLMRGYFRSAEPSFDAQGWFHTGDLALRHGDGGIEIVGRSKDLIISGGENIHPAEIENLAAAWPGVAEAVVVGLPDPRWGEVPVLVLVPQPGASIDTAALLASFDGRLARYKHPRRVLVQANVPRTALGKVQKAALRSSLQA